MFQPAIKNIKDNTDKARVFLSLGLRESGFENQGRRTEKN